MSQAQKQSLITKQTLTEKELRAIKELTDICNRHENLHMRISWDMLQSRPGVEINDFLFYIDGQLVGYLCIDSWGIEEKELTGMVHPDHRRKGIFRQLFEASKKECQSRGAERLLMICERSSNSGQAWIKTLGAERDFSEHEMVLENFQESMAFDDRLIFRPADSGDLDLLITIRVGSFGDTPEAVRPNIEKHLQDPSQHYYVATLGGADIGCKEPVGSLRLDEGAESIGIYGFGVLPEYRRRGYGRQMLEEVIHTIRAKSQKPIMLDVDVDNTPALALYRSCGFQIKTTYDYYKIDLK